MRTVTARGANILATVKYQIITLLVILISVVVFTMPFHAFLTVWAAHLFGHYTAFRLWKELILVVCLVLVGVLIIMDEKIRSEAAKSKLAWVFAAYCVLVLIAGIISYIKNGVSAKALGYGLIVDLRLPLFFLVAWATVIRTKRLRTRWQQLIVISATIVAIFGLLQLVLPLDFLKHFGYGSNTIWPYETINHNDSYRRIFSTLRGANPLGTYLIIPISVLAIQLTTKGWRWLQGIILLLCILAEIFSFSRGAWIGTAVALVIIIALAKFPPTYKKIVAGGAGALIVIAAILVVALHDNTRFQNIFTHTQDHSTVKSTSDTGHMQATKTAIKDVATHPLGHGTGTAGPASVYNTKGTTKVAENYYLQLGQEVGWLGLALFLAMNAIIGYLLWTKREDTLSLSLFASLVGITVVNLTAHAWADDTLAYVWWGLAGIAMVSFDEAAKKSK